MGTRRVVFEVALNLPEERSAHDVAEVIASKLLGSGYDVYTSTVKEEGR